MSATRLLWGLLRYRPWLALLNLTLAVVVASLDLLPGLLMRAYFDSLSAAAPARLSAEAAAGLLVLTALARTVIKTNAVLVYVLHDFVATSLLRRNALAAILQPAGVQAATTTGAALNSLRDDADGAGRLVGQVITGLSLLVFTIGALTVMLRIDARLTLLVFLPLVAVTVIVQRAGGRLQTYRQASRGATSRVTGALGEMLEAIQALQLAGGVRDAVVHLDRLNEQRRQLAVRDAVLRQVLDAIFGSTVTIGTGLILLLAAESMRSGAFTVGDFALFAYYLAWVGWFVQATGSLLAQHRQAGVAVERLTALAPSQPPDALVAPHALGLRRPLPPLILPARTPADRLERLTVRGLTYRHPGSERGIMGLNLTIERGQIVVITGRIGAGKTTLLRALLGLLPRDEGTIWWNDQRIDAPADWLTPPRAAYTPQTPRLFSETLRDNILLGLPEERVDLAASIHTAVLEPDLAALPAGLATLVGPRGVRLSGGQVQRTAAARMLVREPALLVIDDLSSALDVETEARLWDRLFTRSDTTALVVSHRRAALERADQIIVLDDGRVTATGRLPALLAGSAEFQRLWHSDERDNEASG